MIYPNRFHSRDNLGVQPTYGFAPAFRANRNVTAESPRSIRHIASHILIQEVPPNTVLDSYTFQTLPAGVTPGFYPVYKMEYPYGVGRGIAPNYETVSNARDNIASGGCRGTNRGSASQASIANNPVSTYNMMYPTK